MCRFSAPYKTDNTYTGNKLAQGFEQDLMIMHVDVILFGLTHECKNLLENLGKFLVRVSQVLAISSLIAYKL